MTPFGYQNIFTGILVHEIYTLFVEPVHAFMCNFVVIDLNSLFKSIKSRNVDLPKLPETSYR